MEEFAQGLPEQESKKNWNKKKEKSVYISDIMYLSDNEDFTTRKINRVNKCAKYLWFKKNEENFTLDNARFCRYRLCPVCIWRKSLKAFSNMSQIMEHIQEPFSYLFITLTIRNCSGSDLKKTLDKLLHGYKIFMQRLNRCNIHIGSYRSLEITKNKTTGHYHPHIHLLLLAPRNYFTNKRLYKTNKWYSETWKECLNIEYNPVIDVRKINGNNIEELTKAILEVTKYPIKDTDLFYYERDNAELVDKDIETLNHVNYATYNRRLISFGGLLERIRRELKLEDVENGNLLNINDQDENGANYDELQGYYYNVYYRLFARSPFIEDIKARNEFYMKKESEVEHCNE